MHILRRVLIDGLRISLGPPLLLPLYLASLLLGLAQT